MRRRPANREDRGATAIMIAISMLVLMGFTAITIDGGLAYGDRRVLASAADVGALAALQFARPSLIDGASACGAGSLQTQAACRGAEEAMEVVNGTLPGRFSLADWALGSCSDPNKPMEFTIDANVGGTVIPCISFTADLLKSRVKMPDTDLPTTFGRLIGFNSIRTGANAEVGLTGNASADIIPNSPTASVGPELCLFSNQAPQTIPPCAGSLSGFAGFVDLALYGSAETPQTCSQGGSNLRIAINLAKGSDHDLFPYSSDPIVNDHAFCPIPPEVVNEVVVQPGQPSIGSITAGLITGVMGSIQGQPFTASPGRIVCVPLPFPGYSTDCATVRGANLDHTGLWEYLDLALIPDPSACDPRPATHSDMALCMTSGLARFTKDIADNGRFAAVPILSPAPSGPGSYLIDRFDAVWIETLFFGCNANRCLTIHSPGEDKALQPVVCPDPIDNIIKNCGWFETGPLNVEGMVAFHLPLITLPPEITDTFPGSFAVRGFNLTK